MKDQNEVSLDSSFISHIYLKSDIDLLMFIIKRKVTWKTISLELSIVINCQYLVKLQPIYDAIYEMYAVK